jgi:hypothetical protein
MTDTERQRLAAILGMPYDDNARRRKNMAHCIIDRVVGDRFAVRVSRGITRSMTGHFFDSREEAEVFARESAGPTGSVTSYLDDTHAPVLLIKDDGKWEWLR